MFSRFANISSVKGQNTLVYLIVFLITAESEPALY